MFFKKWFSKNKQKKIEKENKKYVIDVVTYHGEDGYSSHWHGWLSGKWLYTYEEALKEKEKLKEVQETVGFDEINICEINPNDFKLPLREGEDLSVSK